jgi:hypothetical protein
VEKDLDFGLLGSFARRSSRDFRKRACGEKVVCVFQGSACFRFTLDFHLIFPYRIKMKWEAKKSSSYLPYNELTLQSFEDDRLSLVIRKSLGSSIFFTSRVAY